jgi:ubiquitin-activating enzyme E1
MVPFTIPIEFEKDDDNLGHVNWICVCSNMRNLQYLIPQIDLWETRKIAGNIIPALITTTSIISGFQILEFIRVIKLYLQNKLSNQSKSNEYIESENKKNINFYKNRYLNLNINYCDGVNPSPVQTFKLYNDTNITLWTNFKITNLNTNQIISQIEAETKKKIEFMTHGNKTIYDGDDIYIDIIDPDDKNTILVLLEDIPIGLVVLLEQKN